MGYLIAAGCFLAVGLGLLIWGLVERKRRYEAELKLRDATAEAQKRGAMLDALQQRAGKLQSELTKSAQQLDVVRNMLYVARAKLMSSGDPKVVKLWLDNEMNDKDI